MTEQHRLRVRTVFAQAADLPRHERGAFLDAACRGEADLRAEVEALLAYDSGFGMESRRGRLPEEPTGSRARGNAARFFGYGRTWTSLACRFTSAAIASSAGTGKVAWAPSTRQNRTTRAAPSPSR